jgi:acyl CoA:acetate/3-ketoacid CoA transferase alpha subunit
MRKFIPINLIKSLIEEKNTDLTSILLKLHKL